MRANTIAYLFLAGNIIREAETNKYTYIGVFSSIRIPKDTSFIYQHFWAACRIEKINQGKNEIEISVISPNKEKIGSAILRGESTIADADLVAFFPVVKIDKPGKHYLKVTLNGEELDDDEKFYFDVIKE